MKRRAQRWSVALVAPLVLVGLCGALPGVGPVTVAGGPPEGGDERLGQEELERITREIQAEIEALRGQKFKRPVKVATIDRAGFLAYAERRMAKMTKPGELEAREDVAKLLGAVDAELDLQATTMELLQEQVGGFYDPGEDAFWIIETFTGDLARVILAHELTHALDDQLYGLDEAMEARSGNSDALFAYQALVEGSGTSVMNSWTKQKISARAIDPKALMDSSAMGTEALERAPSYLWKPLLGAYLRGAAFLNRTDSVMKGQVATPETSDYERAFADPPPSSEAILHPERYWDAEQRDLPREVALSASGLPAGFEVLLEDTLGELGLWLCVEPLKKRGGMKGQLAMLGVQYTDDACEGWGGDRMLLLGRDDERYLRLATVWDSEQDAVEFEAALEQLREHIGGGVKKLAGVLGLERAGFEFTRSGDQVTVSSWVLARDTDPAELAAGLTTSVASR